MRELAIVLRARITWLAAALAALLVGHGFVLSVDLYSAASRSALSSTLMARELDPLAGIVRPTLGGLYLAVSLLAPMVAARVLSVEKERRTLQSLLLQTAAPARLVLHKTLAAVAGAALLFVAPLALLLLWRAVGGHLAIAEVAVAVLGHLLYLALVVCLSVAAAAWTATLAQAGVLALLVVAASWAVDASEGFAALAWMGRAVDWSVTTHLHPMERGIFAPGPALWFVLMAVAALTGAWVGVGFELDFDRRRRRLRLPALAAVVAATLVAGALAHRVGRLIDVSELQRGSLPPAAQAALRRLPGPIRIEVWLDRDDARRRQLEADALAKLRIARSDLEVSTPLDDRLAPAEGERVPGYGRIIVSAGAGQRETWSASRKELVTLLFEAAGAPPPDWTQTEYPGYPLVVEGGRRSAVLAVSYAGLPLLLLFAGWCVTRSRRRSQ